MHSETFSGEDPLISVIIAVYNGESHIRDCLESLLIQTFREFEIIVVDDGSTDRTVEIVRSFADERILLLQLERNRGVSFARNRAAERARGRYLSVLDSDDVATPERLSRQAEFMEANPNLGLSGTYYRLESEMGDAKIAVKPLTHEKIIKGIATACPFGNTTLIIRKDIYNKIGGFPEELDHGEDYHLYAKALCITEGANIPEVLVVKRERVNGLTFRMSSFQHFRLGLMHRLYAVKTLRLGTLGYLLAFLSAFVLYFVRLFGLNRELIKTSIGFGR